MQHYQLYLNGQWSSGDGQLTVDNPATGKPFATVSTVQHQRVSEAIADAHAALPAWQAMTAQARGCLLHNLADQLQKQTQAIAKIITLENGKPLAQSRGEVGMSVDHLHWFAEEARRAYGRIVPQQAQGKRHLVIKSPVGVVGAISPWNFPLVLAVRKIAPALAAGCPVILKPASATPISSVLLAQAVEQAEFPPGVFQLVLGSARQIGQEMLSNPLCRKITFTGSTEVGKQLIQGAAQTVTRLSLELGGHAPLIVFDDADMEQAVKGVIIAKFRNTGQSCIAANRIYVQREIAPRFTEALVEKVRELKIGDGLLDGMDIGPLVNQQGLDTALRHVDDAVQKGAQCLIGGKRHGEQGYFMQPTVLADVPDNALCMSEETFAPVAPLCVFETESQVITQANATEYGLAAYAFTTNLNRAMRMAEQLEAGTVGINDAVPSTSNCPFGGVKQSGWGRELGSEGLDAFLETKHVSLGDIAL